MPLLRSVVPARVRSLSGTLVHEAGKFGVVGLLCFVVDVTLYNLLVFGLPGGGGPGPMGDIPLRAKIVATSVAIVVGWLGNRHWTWRHHRRHEVHREFVMYVLVAGLGLLIALICLGVSRYVLGLDSQLADNVSANGVGLALGTLFRFWAYRTFVFRAAEHPRPAPRASIKGDDAASVPTRQDETQRTGAIDT